MSSPLAPTTDPTSVGATDASPLDLLESGPPEEVLEQMAHADQINARLRASGRELCFALSGDGRSLQIELRDTSGNLLRVLSATEAIDLAAGGDVE